MTFPCSVASLWGCYQPHQLPSLMAYCTSSVSRLKNGLPLRTEVPICKLSRFAPPKIDLLLSLDVDLGLCVPLLFLDSLHFVVVSFSQIMPSITKSMWTSIFEENIGDGCLKVTYLRWFFGSWGLLQSSMSICPPHWSLGSNSKSITQTPCLGWDGESEKLHAWSDPWRIIPWLVNTWFS